MNYSEILRVVGQLAGIGGIALGIFLLLVREVIRRVPAPSTMDRERYSKIINRVLLFTFLIALAGLILYGFLTINERSNEALAATSKTAFELKALEGKHDELRLKHERVLGRLKKIEEANLKALTAGIEQISKTVHFDLSTWKFVPAKDRNNKIAKVLTSTDRLLTRTSDEAKRYFSTYATSSTLEPEFSSTTHPGMFAIKNDERIPVNKPSLNRWLLEFDVSQAGLYDDFELSSTVVSWNSFQNTEREFGETLILSPCKTAEIKVTFPLEPLPAIKSVKCYYRTVAQSDVLQPINSPSLTWDESTRVLAWKINDPRLGLHYRLGWEWQK